MSTGLRASNLKHLPETLNLSREELEAEWETLTSKRTQLWSQGLKFSKEDDYRLRQVVASLNMWNTGTENV